MLLLFISIKIKQYSHKGELFKIAIRYELSEYSKTAANLKSNNVVLIYRL